LFVIIVIVVVAVAAAASGRGLVTLLSVLAGRSRRSVRTKQFSELATQHSTMAAHRNQLGLVRTDDEWAGNQDASWPARLERKLNESWERSAERAQLDTPHLRRLRWMMTKMIQLIQVNMAGRDFGPSLERARLPVWSKLIEAIFVYFTAKLCVCLFLQHEHGDIVFELRRANRTIADQHQQPEQHQHVIRELKERLQRSTERLDMFGSPWRDLHRTLEIAYFVIIVLAVTSYFVPRYYAHHIRPLESSLVRVVLDAKKEHANINRSICEHADKYLMSSANYFRISQDFINGLFQLESDSDARRQSKTDSSEHSPSTRKARRHSSITASVIVAAASAGAVPVQFDTGLAQVLLARNVFKLVLAQRLQPLNRRQHWLDFLQSKLVLVHTSLGLIGLAILVSAVLFYPFVMVDGFRLRTGPGDLLFLAEAVVHSLVLVQLYSIYFLALTSTCIDLIKFALDLVDLIDTCRLEIETVRQQVSLLVATRLRMAPTAEQSRHALAIKRLHEHVMVVLFQFRLFKEQLAAMRHVFSFFLGLILVNMSLTPLLGRLIANEADQQARLAVLQCSVLIIIASDCIVLPVCNLYARCIGIYHRLCQLIAHLEALLQDNQRAGAAFAVSWLASGMAHTYWQLRRELMLPDVMLDKVAAQTLFGRVHYGRFLTIHFWCGLLLLSLWFKYNSSGNKLADSFLLF
jgi:hypothetical protein